MENISLNPKCISDQEWLQAINDAAEHITKVKFKNHPPTGGPLSEAELGMKAVEYFPMKAFEKFYSGEKELNPRLTLSKNMIKEVENLMGNQKRKRLLQMEPYDEKLHDLQMYDDEERQIDITYEMAEEAAKGDPDLLAYIEAVKNCDSYEQISEQLNINIKEVYNLKRMLVRRLQRMKILVK